MILAASIAAYVALGWGAFLLWLAIGAAIRRVTLQRRHFGRARASAAGREVLLTRPCAGAEPRLHDNLSSVLKLETEATLRVVMSVDDPNDPALPVIEAVLRELHAAGLEAELAILPPTGPNRKASMLAALHATSTEEFMVNADSNVDLRGFPLDELLAPLGDKSSRVGAAWSPWTEEQMYPGVGPRASAAVLGASLTAFPLLCGIYGVGLVGKLWAARREAIVDCDFGELPYYLGEDLEMANRMLRQGWAITPVPTLACARGGPADFSAVVRRFGRWMLAARGQRPLLMPTYPLLFFATPMVVVLALCGAPAQPRLALLAAGLAVAARVVVTASAQYWSKRRLGLGPVLLEAGLGDLALGLAWIRAMRSREVEWRGHRLRVDRSGRLVPTEPQG